MRAVPTLGLAAALLVVPASTVHANSGGRPGPGCVGCHAGGDVAISLTTSPSSFDPGDEVTVTLAIASAGAVAGVFIGAEFGELSTVPGQGLAEVAAGLTHSQPKSMSGGMTEFAFRWAAPNTPGAVRFAVSVLVGNDNGSSSGDRADAASFDVVFGCESQQFFLDFDADGYGRNDAARLDCVGPGPTNHAPAGGDCDDTRDTVHPDAVELCNQRDDDCDGEFDEDAIPIPLFPDGDGDGFYGQVEGASLDVMMGCVGTPDYAGEPGDCEPGDPSKYPGAEEVCNLYDDNCEGRVDERVRPICGVGWCAREAWTCEVDNCDPGEPQPEVCNLLDDDCDGDLDEDVVCPAGQSCIAGECREAEGTDDTGMTTVGAATGDSGSDATGGTAGSSGGGSGGGCRIDPARAPAAWWLLVLAWPRRRVRST